MVSDRVAGFWSYTHEDNSLDHNRVYRLAERVRDEYSLLTGDELELFVDRDALSWGDEWRARIERALEGTAFFIPVVTPRYFKSQECRNELITFARRATSLGVEELLLPIHYVNVPALTSEAEGGDEAIRLVAAMQWRDWRHLRLVDEEAAQYREAINDLATRLAEVAESVSGRSAERSASAEPEPPSREVETPTPDEPGLLELGVAGEEAAPRLEATLEAFTTVITELGDLGERFSEQMTASDARGAGFAGRLAVAKRFAAALEVPAEQVTALGTAYAKDLTAIDGVVLPMIEQAEQEDLNADEAEAARRLFGTLRGMAHASRETGKELSDLTEALDEAAGMSRELRQPINQLKTGLRSVLDGQTVLEEWDRRIVAMYARRGEEPPAPDTSFE